MEGVAEEAFDALTLAAAPGEPGVKQPRIKVCKDVDDPLAEDC